MFGLNNDLRSSVTGLVSGLADYGFVIQRFLSGSDRPRLYSYGWDDNKLNNLEVFWMNLLSRLEKGLPPEELEGLLAIKFAEFDFEVNRFPKKSKEVLQTVVEAVLEAVLEVIVEAIVFFVVFVEEVVVIKKERTLIYMYK